MTALARSQNQCVGRQVASQAHLPLPTKQATRASFVSAKSLRSALQKKLETITFLNRLEYVYPPERLQSVVARVNAVNFKQLSAQWRLPLELAYDLAPLALYDVVIFADDSGSMAFEENGQRISDLNMILGRVSEVATLFDDDGIQVRFMNSKVQGNGIRTAAAAAELVKQVSFSGMMPLGGKLNANVIQPLLVKPIRQRKLEKPILVFAITDGEPVGEPKVTTAQMIKSAKEIASKSAYGPGAIAFQFAQVGRDQAAQAFLGELDNDPEIGGMIDATSYCEMEAEEWAQKGATLTPELWLLKCLVGAIDPSYDEQD
ncbi:hypothetical protein WJX72_006517 [[Myrmecia] bisecta]|uniref:VWFA domain-containing protein n=1 Tax=[Myrmecia] bisecta TaxID=41462 RepID=A0AAW1QRR7_9CHLO